ncbi:DNA cytosine methyltransferase [Glycocaulis profundi]|nr:DNA cytosine methyltransferase [Glycocaulis profundi]
MSRDPRHGFYEFFAGGGMARLGLGPSWDCLYANDFDARKAATYRDNFPGHAIDARDVWAVEPADLPGRADLAWASFPCQDLSLAGPRGGIKAARSSAFYGFWRLIEALGEQGRAPRLLAIENVSGLLTSNNGRDFAALCRAMTKQGYRFGALEIDASHFLPQSRPRLFVIAARGDVDMAGFTASAPDPASPFHTEAVRSAVARLPAPLRKQAMWLRLPAPPKRNAHLDAILEPDRPGLRWHEVMETGRLLTQMAPVHQAKLEAAMAKALETGERQVGAVFRRTRWEDGERRQRAEVRFDGLAGCLRTPGGGSSRQFLVVIEADIVRSRPLTARETARLMGLPDDYRLPATETAALHVTGDGVAVPAVAWLSAHLLTPLLEGAAEAVAAE